MTPGITTALGELPPHTRTTAGDFTQPLGGKALGVLDEMASG